MRIQTQKRESIRFRFAAAILALFFAADAAAQNQNTWPVKWTGDGVKGYLACQTALDKSLNIARARLGNPLVVIQPTCESATLYSPSPPSYLADYRRTDDFPTTPNRQVFFSPDCTNAGLGFDAVRGWSCTPSAALRNIGRACPTCGNPINPGYGNKMQRELDYAGAGPFPLRFERVHNSALGNEIDNLSGLRDPLGIHANWTHNYERRLSASGPTQNNNPQAPPVSFVTAAVSRPDGKSFAFNLVGGVFVADVDLKGERLEKLANGWKFTTSEDEIEIYDAEGKLVSISNRAGLTQTLSYFQTGVNLDLLQSVTDPFGRTMTFNYQDRRLDSISLPGGGQLSYGYATDAFKQLRTVTYPDGGTRTYHYEGPVTGGYARMLTGITDELGVRYATWVYDYDFFNSSFAGRPILSQHAGGAGKVTVSYAGGVTTVTTFVTPTVSATRTYGFQDNYGVIANNAITGPACPQCGQATTFYNGVTGLQSAWIDWNGNASNRGIDPSRDLETVRIEGRDSAFAFTPDTVITAYQWHPAFRLPTTIAEPLRITTNSYDADGTLCGARGALCSKSIQATTDANGSQGLGAAPTGAPRVWTYTYNANGQVLTANGPRTDVADVTTYTYDAQGNVATIANALGQTTQITAYNVHGQPLTIVDPNGLTTTLTYDGRQRLTSRTVGTELTSYTYDLAGQLTRVTLPDGSFLSYTYDGAHRLTGIADNLGNRIAYTLDLAGNRTREEVFDPLNVLAQTKSRVYSSINRLFQEVGAAGQTTEYAYDPQGNVTSVKDPLLRITSNQYDHRNRLSQTTDPANGVTKYAYNGLSALTQVTDPRNLATAYTLDGLGNLNQQASPDTGITVNTYDAAGNLLTQTDAKGQVTAYAYDALNRVALITFHDGSRQAYAYDQGVNGVGRLSSITETDPANQTTSVLAYAYDLRGRVTAEARTVAGVTYTLAYTYDASGRLTGMSYPSGRSVSYTLDLLGRVSQVTTTKDGQSVVVVQNVQYHPFGGAKSWTLGNGQVTSRSIDLDGRIASYTLGAANYTIGFDAASRITGIAQAGNPANTNTYGYDSLDRLSSAILPSSNFGYSYDAVGNRLSKTVGANTDTYAYGSTSNRIASLNPFGSPPRTFTLDANGSTVNDALNQYSYDTRGRMVQAVSAAGATSYQVNALGQRIRKINGAGDTIFQYDTWGKLIAESDPGGTARRELIYLGDIPVMVWQ